MNTVKTGLSLLVRYLACVIMSFVIYLSFAAVFTLTLTEVIGYDAYVTDSKTGQSENVYTHYYANGEDTRKAEYEAMGVTVYTAELRSELTGAGSVLVFTAAQVVCLALFIALVSNRMYQLGIKDAEAFQERCVMHWLIPSFYPAAVNMAGFLLLVAGKLQYTGNHGLSIYRYVNYHLYGLQRLILGTGNNCTEISWLSVLLSIFPTVLTLSSCGILYEFGYRGFHPLIALKNKIKYKGD